MKRAVLLTLTICLLAGQASAALFDLDVPLANQFRQLSVIDGGVLYLVIDKPGTTSVTPEFTDGTFTSYLAPMQYEVGFLGRLADEDQDNDATITIGKTDPGLSGTYDGFLMPVANDDDDPWQIRAFVDVEGTRYLSDLLSLPGQSAGSVTVNLPGATDFADVTAIGFLIGADFTPGEPGPSNPDFFHISVVPVPGAILLGLLGLGAAGLRLRRFA